MNAGPQIGDEIVENPRGAPARGGESSPGAGLECPIGRHRIDYHWLYNWGRQVKSSTYEEIETLERWELLYKSPFTEMVGARIRRLRRARDLTQRGLLKQVERPRGGTYSVGFLSRIEKGYANAPLYAYVHIAEALELDPGRLMGSDEAQKPISESEMTLVRYLRRVHIAPDAAIAAIASVAP